ncbi:hypothetical protein [Bradyrhizobium sp. AUGA SZCCT0160]|uniref:hypothetical protein n=1 Tax=Bradyrhizobium sp. AUGA SZCCT0160 TaxID=2807662 RepID=UPI001BA74D1F|nr:hypothetical protein [Bradyrhizobium sp. AUGA SZCCT0160]MBR1190548.1 hypothetical protein [Bradyrhizobium sp. AUGA SZCCT0160]
MMKVSQFVSDLPAPRAADEFFSVECFLAEQRELVDIVKHRATFDRLRRKVELTRRLLAFYDRDWRQPGDGIVAAPQYAMLLCAQLLALAEADREWTCLNAAFKMLDGILLAPEIVSAPSLKAWAERLAEGMTLSHA